MKNLVTQAEFARIANVNRATVHKWVKSGRIQLQGKLIDVDAALKSREATESHEPRHQARKEQFDEQKATAGSTTVQEGLGALSGMGIGEKVGLAIRQQQLKHLTAKAEQANVDLDKAAGQLVERTEIDYVLTDFGRTVSDRLQSLPDRYTPELAACSADPVRIHKALEDIGAQVLSEIHDHLNRKAEETLP
jgi:hypothetical protein